MTYDSVFKRVEKKYRLDAADRRLYRPTVEIGRASGRERV